MRDVAEHESAAIKRVQRWLDHDTEMQPECDRMGASYHNMPLNRSDIRTLLRLAKSARRKPEVACDPYPLTIAIGDDFHRARRISRFRKIARTWCGLVAEYAPRRDGGIWCPECAESLPGDAVKTEEF